MPKYRWPSDPPGKPASHSISWQQHQSNQGVPGTGAGAVSINGQRVTPEQWQSGGFLDALNQSANAQGTGPAQGFGGPEPTPQPVDPAFEAQKLGATWNVQTSQGEAKYQKGETAWGTGYNADGSLNSSNPYSQAMLLQNEYKRGVTGTNNSMAAAGQLYSGARLNAQAHNDRVYAEGSSALKDQARQAYHGIDYGQLQSYGQNALGVSGADYEALRRAVYG